MLDVNDGLVDEHQTALHRVQPPVVHFQLALNCLGLWILGTSEVSGNGDFVDAGDCLKYKSQNVEQLPAIFLLDLAFVIRVDLFLREVDLGLSF